MGFVPNMPSQFCRALKGSKYKGNGQLPEKPLVYYG